MDGWCVVDLPVDGIGRREDTIVVRAGFSYQAEPFELGLRDKSDNFAHLRLHSQRRFRQVITGRWDEGSGSTDGEIGSHPSKSWKLGPMLSVSVSRSSAHQQAWARLSADAVHFGASNVALYQR